MANWYCGSTKWTAVASYANLHLYAVGDIVRQLGTPTVGNERVFRCTTLGTSGAAEPTWNITPSATTTAGTAVFTEITGQAVFNGDGGGSAWAAPHARLQNAVATGWAAAGDSVYVSNNHAETQAAAMTITFPVASATMLNVLCVSDTTVPPTTLATTGAVAVTGVNPMNLDGFAYVYGLKFSVGSTTANASIIVGSTSGVASGQYYDSCSFTLNGTNAGGRISLNRNATATIDRLAEFRNCSFALAAAGQSVGLGGGLLNMVGCLFAATGVVPTTLFSGFNQVAGSAVIRGSDLSAVTGNLFSAVTTSPYTVFLENCKIASAVTFAAGSYVGQGGMQIHVQNVAGTGINYNFQNSNYLGTDASETTTVRSGGASDGITPLSWKIISTANATYGGPFQCMEIAAWNDIISVSKTATIEITSNSTLTNADVWMELEYMGSTGSPQTSIVSSRKTDFLASATTLASSSATWGGSTTTKQKLSVSFTAQIKGPIKARVFVAKPSLTVFVDPLITIV